MFDLARTYARLGHDILVLAPHAYSAKVVDNIDGVKVVRFRYFWPSYLQSLAYGSGIPANVKRVKGAMLQFLVYLISEFIALNKAIASFKPQVVHALWAFPQGFVCAFLKTFRKITLVTSVFGAEAYLAQRHHLEALIKFGVNSSNEVTANSLATIKAAVACGADSRKFHLIMIGVDTEVFNPMRDGWWVRERYNLGNSPLILSVGRLVERKGHQYLSEAMPNILRNVRDAKLMIVGSGPLRDHLEELTQKLSIKENVIFAGRVSEKELPDYYAACDIFCLPAIIDSAHDTEGGQSLAVKEAMATGKPVVASSVGGIPDLIHDGKNGLLVKQRDAKSLAKAVTALLQDKNLRDRIAREGHEDVMRKLSLRAVAKRFIEVYERVIMNAY